jgi:hypothetical protein
MGLVDELIGKLKKFNSGYTPSTHPSIHPLMTPPTQLMVIQEQRKLQLVSCLLLLQKRKEAQKPTLAHHR